MSPVVRREMKVGSGPAEFRAAPASPSFDGGQDVVMSGLDPVEPSPDIPLVSMDSF